MDTIALELAPPDLDGGHERAVEEGRKVAENSRAAGLADRIGHLMIPGIIAEDDDRPIEMKPKMDVIDFWNTVRPEIGDVKGLCTQVTAFMDKPQLTDRIRDLQAAGMEGIAFVGVPRTMSDGEGGGLPPTDALTQFQDVVPNRGSILIPTREGEHGRFNFKCERGATYGMTQLLYSDAIVGFLKEFADKTPHRPEILLSFGFVPGVEGRRKLIDWLIQDPGNPAVEAEQKFIAGITDLTFEERKQKLLDLYKRVIDGVVDLGFPLSLHLEAPYGYSKPAFDVFAAMIDYWAPKPQAA
ncbi:mycobacterial-type methylenetetrahydrofolate reductase [Saccharopolyspora sp. NFXS83]|uniref:mycobacterial-type methylenetetrahydrofolate reductase n=1 Tax=Saccharopolyspora sp. NFXS83 TaxID=2993560 RepID=UPI00224ACDC1|nr:mycobacterial-type methylenetetrahydrofolate reductase [Saccharopolyspora sp. NFXS83]MCX2734310.1 mycobacterial-type methylenetetrahydrofolate reductase [Saccharopolyspora sp. NFXS83]